MLIYCKHEHTLTLLCGKLEETFDLSTIIVHFNNKSISVEHQQLSELLCIRLQIIDLLKNQHKMGLFVFYL